MVNAAEREGHLNDLAGPGQVLIRHVWVRRRRLGTGRTTEHPAESGGQSKGWTTGAAASHACPGVRTRRRVSSCVWDAGGTAREGSERARCKATVVASARRARHPVNDLS